MVKKTSQDKNKRVDEELKEIINRAEEETKSEGYGVKGSGVLKDKGVVILIVSMVLVGVMTIGMMALGKSERRHLNISNGNQTTSEGVTNSKEKSTGAKSGGGRSAKIKQSKERVSKTKEAKVKGERKEEPVKPHEPDNPIEPEGGNDKGNTASNIINGGFLAAQEDYVYYKQPQSERGMQVKNMKTGEVEMITEKEVGSINVVGKRMYLKMEGYDNMVVEADIGGKVAKAITVGSEAITAYREYIITGDGKGIYKYNISGNKKEEIYRGEVEACANYNGKIYFKENGRLKVIDEASKDIEEIDEDVEGYGVDKEGLYYIKGGEVYKEGGKDEGIEAISINVSDGRIYYGNGKDNGSLYARDIETGEDMKISDIKAEKICVGGGIVAVENGGLVTLIG